MNYTFPYGLSAQSMINYERWTSENYFYRYARAGNNIRSSEIVRLTYNGLDYNAFVVFVLACRDVFLYRGVFIVEMNNK